MAQPTGSFSTVDAVGNREDLADFIYDVSPTDTPFVSKVKKVDAEAVTHEWQTDALASASNSNVVIEGNDAETDASTATTRLSNVCQISDKVARVTNTQQVVRKAGRRDELAYQMVKRGKELKRDMETMCLMNNAKVSRTDSVAGEMASVLAYIKTNVSMGSGGANPAGTGSDARTDGTQRAFTETLLLNTHQTCWDNGGEPHLAMMGSFNKRTASGFTGVATKYKDITDRRILASADVYESDFGTLTLLANRFMRSRDCLLFDMEFWALAYLRNMTTINLAITGDSVRKQILCEYTLEARNEISSGLVADLTTS